MAHSQVTVAACLWGKWPDGKWPQWPSTPHYSPRSDLGLVYVNRMFNGIRCHYRHPFQFVLFTDRAEFTESVSELHPEIDVRPLNSPSQLGCLPKFKVYDPANGFTGRVVVMDLDCVIVGSLDELFSYDGEFITRKMFRSQKLPPSHRNTSGGDMLGFEAGWGTWIWEWFVNRTADMERITAGRERFLYRKRVKRIDFWQDLYPGQLISYKRHVKTKGRLSRRARIVSCHGYPRPHEISADWIREHWQDQNSSTTDTGGTTLTTGE